MGQGEGRPEAVRAAAAILAPGARRGPVQTGCNATDMSGIAHPFGAHSFAYAEGSILPTGTAKALDDATSAFYQKWKAIVCRSEGVLRRHPHRVPQVHPGTEATVSEAMGYGMVILPMMAGCDADAHAIYDSMHAFIVAHTNANGLLSWKQLAGASGACEDDEADRRRDRRRPRRGVLLHLGGQAMG